MKVSVQNEDNESIDLEIVFRKTAVDKRRRVNGKELIDTICLIYLVGPYSMRLKELAYATAKQNPLDRYNKIVGKKIAFAKAIANIAFLNSIIPHSKLEWRKINMRRRAMRQHIWCVFHQTFGRWN